MHARRRLSSGRPLPPHLVRAATLLAVLAVSLGAAPEARAACTTAICAPATGTCAINGGPHKIDNGCVLNFDGRDVTLNGTLDIDDGAVTIRARNFTVASGGLIDGSPQGGFITILATGGNILVQSSAQRGIDMIGQEQGGAILLDATGNVTIDGRLKANNGNTALDASGGSIELRAGGNLRISGSSDVDASGGRQADGGSVDFLAVGRIDIEKDVLVSGGEGGDVTLEAGDELLLNGRIIDDSTGGGGSGGFVDIAAEKTITVGKSIRSAGSTSTDLFGGDGGFLTISSAAGDVIVRDEITVQSGAPDGGGGEIEIFAARSVKLQAGRLNARGEGIESFAGTIFLDSDLDVTIGALVDSSGGGEGGGIEIGAGRNVEIANTLDVRARQPATFSGSVIVDAGIFKGGAVTVKAAAVQAQAGRVLATGAGCSPGGGCSFAGTIELNGCNVTVEGKPAPGSTITPGALDASAPGADGAGGGIVMVARRLLTLGIGATLDATGTGVQGTIELVFPSSRQPMLAGQTITPPPIQIACGEADCPGDPACRSLCLDFCDCGDGRVDEFEQCDTSAQGCATGAGQVCGVTGTFRECICIATCGNDTVDAGEECDGAQNGATCRTLGFFNTTPVPCVSCAFDTAQCTAGTCGDGVLAPRNELNEKGLPGFFEVCDGTDVGSESCVSLGYTRGTLACKADCSGFNISGCQVGRCGDGVPDAGEECDRGGLNSNAPNASCRLNCRLPRCGDGVADTQLGEQCDDANNNDNDPCLKSCRRAACGDGILCSALGCTTGPNGGPEQCDAVAVCCLPTCGRRVCSDGILCGNFNSNGCCHPDASCNDGDPCTTDQCDLSRGCTHTPRPGCCRAAAECGDGNPCTDDRCTANVCAHSANTVACDDRNACTSGDACADGACRGTPNTAACDDGNACTEGDACAGGTCGGAAVTCVAPGACQEVAGCNPTTGCEFRLIPNCCTGDGVPCEDGNPCTHADTCAGGTCIAGAEIQCVPLDQCHAAGTCDPATGLCSNPAVADGIACDDGNPCTQADTCQAGVCVGASPVVCSALDQCHAAGECAPGTGQCSQPAKVDGTGCEDGNACTQVDTCQVGVCVGASPVMCTALDQCHVAGACDPQSGACSQPAKANGTGCDDGNACTQVDTCQVGVCVGASPVACTALDQCHAAGVCDPATGGCSTPPRPDGTPCSDGDACTESDSCRAGTCAGVEIGCDDGNPCTNDRCEGGGCVQESNDATCDDADPCTVADQCREGRCFGAFGLGADIVCSAQSLLAAPCGAEPVPVSLRKFIEGKMNSARKLLQKADAAAAKGKDAKIAKLRIKAVKALEKISKKVTKAVAAGKPDQQISEACGAQIDALLQQRRQLIGAFTF